MTPRHIYFFCSCTWDNFVLISPLLFFFSSFWMTHMQLCLVLSLKRMRRLNIKTWEASKKKKHYGTPRTWFSFQNVRSTHDALSRVTLQAEKACFWSHCCLYEDKQSVYWRAKAPFQNEMTEFFFFFTTRLNRIWKKRRWHIEDWKKKF
jgi:hypothetical protein